MGNYVCYHLHSDFSLLDSTTDFKKYVDKAKEFNQTAIAFSEHGNIYNWISKKLYCDKVGIKYIHGCEVYLTEKLFPKIKDNYHTCLYARNMAGVKELNYLISKSTQEDHFYYKPRVSFDEFLSLSNNIISTSACLQSPLNRLSEENEYYTKLLNKYTFYEVQPHINSDEQKDFNKKLLKFSKKYNKQIIAGTDTHNLNTYKAECRKILQKAKKIHFKDDNSNFLEDKFDLTYKSYEELYRMFIDQKVLSEIEISTAIENTNILSNLCENITLDTSFKYPKLSDNDEKILQEIINKKYKEKLKSKIISGGEKYIKRIREEFSVFKKLNMQTYMLFMSNLICWCRDNDIPVGPSRGSVAGSLIAYILDITDVDPLVWNTVFSRFANENRQELGDIDIDLPPDQREQVYKHMFDEFGKEKVAYILAIGTISEKGTIDEIGRALEYDLDKVSKIKQEYDKNKEITKEKYKDFFYYFDGLVDTKISRSQHPAGIVVSPIELLGNYGIFYKDEYPIMQIDMDDIHEVGLNKFDLLGLVNISIIRDCCKNANIKYPRIYQIDFKDEKVWKDMLCSPVGVFQMESDMSFNLLKKYEPKSIDDVSLVNACIRPSGESYREKLIRREKNKNPSEIIDELLKDTYGWLLYQEQVIAFLQEICGFSGGHADNVRRACARKDKDRMEKELPQILDGYCKKSDKSKDIAEEEAKSFIKIIEDSSSYMFGKNHSIGYSLITYICAYLRYYYPGEFIAAYLNNSETMEDFQKGAEITKTKKISMEKQKFRKSTESYIYDKDTNTIYKGLESIKYINSSCAKDLYNIRFVEFDTFTDFCVYITENTSINTRQIKVLISLDFFEEFGKSKKLYDMYLYFCSRYSKAHIEKTKELRIKEIKEYENSLPDENLGLFEQIECEKEYCGYISFIRKCDKRFCYVLDVDLKYTPRISIYSLATGKTIECKIQKSMYLRNKIKKDDVVFCKNFSRKQNWKKTEIGFEKTEGFSIFLNDYIIYDKEKAVKVIK